MAYTKVFAIRARLDDRVKYAVNGEKTELDERIVYTADPEKTDTVRFVTTLNCRPAETAFAAMQKTKKKYKKTGGVLGYHFIQSFAPGEVTPEQAHEIGCEFARRLFGEDFEVVIGTHLDKAHPHNHIVVNSVSRTDGHKYHSSPESYYNDVRGTSDALCRENDLSVITPQGKGKHYAEWKAEQGGKPTVRGIIRADIDTIIGQAYTYDSFLMLLRKNGYEVRRGPNRKYTTVKPPGAKRAIRLDSLGEGYTEAELDQRIRVLEWDIRLLEEQRKPLYQERRNTNDEEAQAKYSAEIQQQTAALREKRGELRLCRRIQADIPRVSQQCQQAQAERQENLKKKEEHEHEYQR